jgi:hypothetical protein
VSYAPLKTVPEGASRYRDLPVLERCSHCGEPIDLFSRLQVYTRAGRLHTNLCRACATRLAD